MIKSSSSYTLDAILIMVPGVATFMASLIDDLILAMPPASLSTMILACQNKRISKRDIVMEEW